DLPLRALRSGYKVLHVPDAAITHKGGASFSQVPEKHAAEFYRNLLLFYDKHAGRRKVWLSRGLKAILLAKRAVLHACAIIARSESAERRRMLCSVKLEALQRPRTPTTLPAKPLVSVIIPTKNRASVFGLLRCLSAQSYRRHEVIVIDQGNGSIHFGNGNIDLDKRVKVFSSKTQGRSDAKNMGMYHATGDLLLFCDDDIEPPPQFIETHVNLHAGATLGGVSLRHTEPGLPYTSTKKICRVTWYGRVIDGYHSDVTTYVRTLTGPNMSFSRSVQKQAGFFESGLVGTSILEEPDYSERILRQDLRILFSNRISFPHNPQLDGNKAVRAFEPVEYYRAFHHNEVFYFLKNRHRLLLMFVVPFCFLRSVKQAFQHNRSMKDAWSMFAGVFNGIQSYYRYL
ncbi:MAG TPA: glycosyltransferase, partial [Bacteroidota bacterium]